MKSCTNLAESIHKQSKETIQRQVSNKEVALAKK